jgi:hypothetical protein
VVSIVKGAYSRHHASRPTLQVTAIAGDLAG